MKRREFLRLISLGLAACSMGQITWPRKAAPAAAPELRLAFLADAHLMEGDDRRPEAQALARAVSEIRGLEPAPSLVLFAGDLAHRGHPAALTLGREILADLPSPCLLLMGEGDGLPDAAAPWRRLFGDPWFSQVFQKTENGKQKTFLQILGLHTAWCPGPGGPLFLVGAPGRRWLTRELNRLDPEIPLLVLSHAPLNPIFRPWQQWTLDGPQVLALLSRFRQVVCFHGHTHYTVVSGQWSVKTGIRANSF
jgi:Icc protein